MKSKVLLLAFLSFFVLLFNVANAAETEPNNTPAQANVLTLNGSNTGSLPSNTDVDWYKITTNADGAIALTLTVSNNQYARFELYDTLGVIQLHTDYTSSSFTYTVDGLAKGTYYVKVYPYSDGNFADYTISNTLTVPALANDKEPDSTFAQANTFALNGSTTGHVGYYFNNHKDTADWYKFTTNSDGAISLELTVANNNYLRFDLYDGDGKTLLRSDFTSTDYTYTVDGLAQGTYYVRVYQYADNNFAPYTLKNTLIVPLYANDAEPDSTVAQAITFGLNDSATGHINYYYNHHKDSVDWYKFTTNADGAINLQLDISNNNYLRFDLYDGDGKTLLRSDYTSTTYNYTVDGLAQGTYYIKVYPYSDNYFASYKLFNKLFTIAQPNDKEPDSTIALANTLPLNGSVTGHINYYYNQHKDSADWYKLTTSADGAINLKLDIPNNQYLRFDLYDGNGVTQLHSDYTSTTFNYTIDGLAKGVYYVKVYPYSDNYFAPYTLTDSLYTYNQNDTVPNDHPYMASTIPANRTVTGHTGFYYNGTRDTTDYWKINYTGTDGNLALTFHLQQSYTAGYHYTRIYVYQDTLAAPILNDYFASDTYAKNFTGLTQGYYYVQIIGYSPASDYTAYSITDAFTQVNIAAAAVKSTRPSLDSCGGNSITYTLSKSHSPYGVQLYRNGVKYDSVNVISDTARFNNLPDGNYYATVYGDGATDAAYGTSATTTFLPPTPKGLNTTNIGVHTATLHWNALSCIKTYRVQYRLSSATTWTTVNDPNDLTGVYTLTGLAPYTNYTWRVASADTAQGTEILSPYSDTLLFKTLSDTAHIVKATKTQGATCSSSTIVYNVTNSVNPYTVQLYRYGSVYGSAVQANNTATFASLPSGVYYATATGTGSGGSIGTSGTDTITPPVPSGLYTNVVTSTSAQINWTPISCVKYFTIQYKVTGAATWTTISTQGNVSADSLTGLLASTEYVWQIASVDSANGYSLSSAYSATDTFTTTSVLPVTLLKFSAAPINNTVQISWQTTNETNSKSFTVLRSADGISFSAIGTVSAFGNTNTQHQYSFIDNAPQSGTNYYRLRQTDNDGRFTDSKTVTVTFTGTSLFTLYPNPAVSVVHIGFSSSSAAALVVYDANGKAVMQKTISSGSGSQTINVSSLAAGVYTIVLQQNNHQQSLKFVKR